MKKYEVITFGNRWSECYYFPSLKAALKFIKSRVIGKHIKSFALNIDE